MEDEKELKCDDTCCSQNLVLLYEGEESRKYLEHHVANYQASRKDVSITLQGVHSPSSSSPLNSVLESDAALLERIQAFPDTWDGAVFPSHMTGALKDRLWDWNDYLQKQRNSGGKIDMDWVDILPFFRAQAQQQVSKKNSPRPSSFFEWQSFADGDTDTGGVVRGKTLYAPLDGDVVSLYYRKDLFEEHQIPVPRTWEEYVKAAIYFYGKPWGPNNSSLSGSCIASSNTNDSSYWASLVLSTMTQTQGTSSGFLLDQETADPILGEAMEETLLILAQESALDKDSIKSNKNSPAWALNEGSCAMTLSWANPFNTEQFKNIGVAPTPGSKRVLNRETGKLETCTPELCPFGTYYNDLGIVNRPSYTAFGGWAGGVSNDSTFSKQKEMADFFSYISNPSESLFDVNKRSTFVTPYRYSHTAAVDFADAGIGLTNDTAFQYTETVKEVNSENTVSDLRIPSESAIRGAINEEVDLYLKTLGENKYESLIASNSANDDLRSATTAGIDRRIRGVVKSAGIGRVIKNYQSSLSIHNGPGDSSMNYIDIPYRDTGWGVAILICFGSIAVMLWVLWNRKKAVMRAFQPYTLIQSAAGFFFMGATLIPLGFDDSLFSKDILDITCMSIPWIYVFGYTLFFTSIYAKIQMCTKIYKHPGKYDRMMVRPIISLKLFCKLFLLNGVLLGIWTAVDPLKWIRTEKAASASSLPYGNIESYGSCRSENFGYPYFAIALFVLNLICIFVAMLQGLKTRMLVLEYRQMEWLQLCLVPFFEAWIIGGPVIALFYDQPTAQYVTFIIVISSSTLTAASAIFGPKEWYVRKHNVLPNESQPARSPTPFIRVLKHPKLESQKHVATLQNRLERYNSQNTELEIDITVLQDKFKKLTDKEKYAAVRGSIYSQHVMQSVRSMMTEDDDDDTRHDADYFKMTLNDMRNNSNKSQIDTIVTKRASYNPRVSELSIDMEDLDQLRAEQGKLYDSGQKSGYDSGTSGQKSGKSLLWIESISGSSFAMNSMRISEEGSVDLSNPRNERSTSTLQSNDLDPSNWPSESNDVVDQAGTPRAHNLQDSKVKGTEISSFSSGTRSKEVSVQMEDLDEMIESDNIRDLKSEADILAEEFKMSGSSFLENVDDLKNDTSDRTAEDEPEKAESTFLEDVADLRRYKNQRANRDEELRDVQLDNTEADTTEEVGSITDKMGEQVMSQILMAEEAKLQKMAEDGKLTTKAELKNDMPESNDDNEGFDETENAASENGDTLPIANGSKVVPLSPDKTLLADNLESLKPISSTGESSGSQIPAYNGGNESEGNGQNAGEPSCDYRPPSKNSFSIDGWTPTSKMLALLSEMSDSTSQSSRASVADSVASLEIISPRHSGVQMGNDIKSLLNHHGFDAVNADSDSNDKSERSDSSSVKLLAKRQKKRELEAKRLAIRRHKQKGSS